MKSFVFLKKHRILQRKEKFLRSLMQLRCIDALQRLGSTRSDLQVCSFIRIVYPSIHPLYSIISLFHRFSFSTPSHVPSPLPSSSFPRPTKGSRRGSEDSAEIVNVAVTRTSFRGRPDTEGALVLARNFEIWKELHFGKTRTERLGSWLLQRGPGGFEYEFTRSVA